MQEALLTAPLCLRRLVYHFLSQAVWGLIFERTRWDIAGSLIRPCMRLHWTTQQ